LPRPDVIGEEWATLGNREVQTLSIIEQFLKLEIRDVVSGLGVDARKKIVGDILRGDGL